MDYRKAGFWQLMILSLLLNFVVQTVHEAGHWVILESSGRGPVWGFNQLLQLWDTMPLHPDKWVETVAPDGTKGWLHLTSSPGKIEYIIMLSAGPIASVLGVLFGLSLLRWSRNRAIKQMGLVLALISSLIMSQYYLRGFHRMGGDEYFLAYALGIRKYIIDIPFGLFFVTAFIFAVRSLGEWRIRIKWLGAVCLGSIPAGLFIMKANSIVLTQVNNDNPLFCPILGWSLPVVIVNILICAALWLWWKLEDKALTDK